MDHVLDTLESLCRHDGRKKIEPWCWKGSAADLIQLRSFTTEGAEAPEAGTSKGQR